MDPAQKIILDGLVEVVRTRMINEGHIPGTSTAALYRDLINRLLGTLSDAEELKVEDAELKACLGLVLGLICYMLGRGWPVTETFGALLAHDFNGIAEILERHNRSRS